MVLRDAELEERRAMLRQRYKNKKNNHKSCCCCCFCCNAVHLSVFALFLAVVIGFVAHYHDNLMMFGQPPSSSSNFLTTDYHAAPLATSPTILTGYPLHIMAILFRTPLIGTVLRILFMRSSGLFLPRSFALTLPVTTVPVYTPLGSESLLSRLPAAIKHHTELKKNCTGKTTIGGGGGKAKELVDLYIAKITTPVAVAREALRRIELSQKTINAFISVQREDVLRQAAMSAHRYADNRPLGPLDGVPVAIKAEINVEGHDHTMGTSFLATAVPLVHNRANTVDNTIVKKLRRAGAIIIGITNMHEIGIGTSGDNPNYGPARNPFDTRYHTGGSSSGSAAAVAAGIVPIAIGTDGGGSIRIPAGLCGVVGMKGTHMRVPEEGRMGWSVCHAGPIAATVEDAALVYTIIASDEPPHIPPAHVASVKSTKSRPLRVGVFDSWNRASAPEFQDAVRVSLEKLNVVFDDGEDAITIHNVTIPHLDIIAKAHAMTILSEMLVGLESAFLPPYDPDNFKKLSAEAQINLLVARGYSADDFLASAKIRSVAIESAIKLFDTVDVIISPTTARTASRIHENISPFGAVDLDTVSEVMRFIVWQNFVGIPAVTVPVAISREEGLPVSVQVTTGWWNEHIGLDVARKIMVKGIQPDAVANSEYAVYFGDLVKKQKK
eukprot:PhM_4_TR17818/c0_g1_i1/m.20695